MLPWNRSRSTARTYDKELYKARSEIECTFNLLKQARRFATRYEKTLRNYAALVTWWRSGVRCSGYGSDRARGSSQA